jgi:oligosaccharide repeat unit polymerase
MTGQKLAKCSLCILWMSPILLLISPYHDNFQNIDPYYLIFFYSLIFGIVLFQIKIKYPEFVSPDERVDNTIITTCKLVNILILLPTVYVIIYLILSGNSIAENREYYINNFLKYNYIFVSSMAFVLLIITYSDNNIWKIFGLINYFMMIFLMMLSGNRQFAFFTIIYVFLYNTINKRKIYNIKKYILYGSIVFIIFIVFGIYRLDYISIGDQADYLGRLFNSQCFSDSIFCDSYLNLIYQYLYGYVGLNILGFQTSLDYFNKIGSLPLFSTTLPVISRRFESFSFVNYRLDDLNEKYDNYVTIVTNIQFPHFFSTMFGAIARESGVIGLIIHAIILISILNILIKGYNRRPSRFNYTVLIFWLSYPFFGFLQFPMSEPFYFNTAITLFLLLAFKKYK